MTENVTDKTEQGEGTPKFRMHGNCQAVRDGVSPSSQSLAGLCGSLKRRSSVRASGLSQGANHNRPCRESQLGP